VAVVERNVFQKEQPMTDPTIPTTWKEVMERGIDTTKLPDFPPGFRRTVHEVHARTIEGQLKVATSRHHEFYCDEPPTIGGQDRYPQPLAYFAAGLGF
jgi:hypothetical protein